MVQDNADEATNKSSTKDKTAKKWPLKVLKNTKICIVGPPSSGKTTLMFQMKRFPQKDPVKVLFRKNEEDCDYPYVEDDPQDPRAGEILKIKP